MGNRAPGPEARIIIATSRKGALCAAGVGVDDYCQSKIARPIHDPQQGACCWMGGHGTVPKEQNTQQSPAFGRSTLPQPRQS